VASGQMLEMLRFVRSTCIAFPMHQDWKVAQGVSARAPSAGTACSRRCLVHQNQLLLPWVRRLRHNAANSHHVQATQNDSRNRINITSDPTHRQWRFDASHWQGRAGGWKVVLLWALPEFWRLKRPGKRGYYALRNSGKCFGSSSRLLGALGGSWGLAGLAVRVWRARPVLD
jgi:hypothetical protein